MTDTYGFIPDDINKDQRCLTPASKTLEHGGISNQSTVDIQGYPDQSMYSDPLQHCENNDLIQEQQHVHLLYNETQNMDGSYPYYTSTANDDFIDSMYSVDQSTYRNPTELSLYADTMVGNRNPAERSLYADTMEGYSMYSVNSNPNNFTDNIDMNNAFNIDPHAIQGMSDLNMPSKVESGYMRESFIDNIAMINDHSVRAPYPFMSTHALCPFVESLMAARDEERSHWATPLYPLSEMYSTVRCSGLGPLVGIRMQDLSTDFQNASPDYRVDFNNMALHQTEEYPAIHSIKDPVAMELLQYVPKCPGGFKAQKDGKAILDQVDERVNPLVHELLREGFDIRLGEKGRSLLKKEISRRFRRNVQLRDECMKHVCRLKNANVLQLLAMSEIVGCFPKCLSIANDYWRAYSERTSKRIKPLSDKHQSGVKGCMKQRGRPKKEMSESYAKPRRKPIPRSKQEVQEGEIKVEDTIGADSPEEGYNIDISDDCMDRVHEDEKESSSVDGESIFTIQTTTVKNEELKQEVFVQQQEYVPVYIPNKGLKDPNLYTSIPGCIGGDHSIHTRAKFDHSANENLAKIEEEEVETFDDSLGGIVLPPYIKEEPVWG